MSLNKQFSVEDQIRNKAKELGFNLVRITNAVPFIRDEKAAIQRIRKGFMGDLPWYTEKRVHTANNPQFLLDKAQSIISVSMPYYIEQKASLRKSVSGKVARYAWGDDYHIVMKKKLEILLSNISEITKKSANGRIFVDDGAINDRAVAEKSGLGWFGKNTNILTSSHGSWILLGSIITDLKLTPDKVLKKNCGSCTTCIDLCPTGAIVGPYVLDSRKCISYLTIELKGIIPRNLRTAIGSWIFGCDICQDVCPVNKGIPNTTVSEFSPRNTNYTIAELLNFLDFNQDNFSKKFKNSPIKRAKLEGLKRNVCIALGNSQNIKAIPKLKKVLKEETYIIKIHAAWALGQIGGTTAYKTLQNAYMQEKNEGVKQEISLSLKDIELR
jgi:epoxyqueuosine reductase